MIPFSAEVTYFIGLAINEINYLESLTMLKKFRSTALHCSIAVFKNACLDASPPLRCPWIETDGCCGIRSPVGVDVIIRSSVLSTIPDTTKFQDRNKLLAYLQEIFTSSYHTSAYVTDHCGSLINFYVISTDYFV